VLNFVVDQLEQVVWAVDLKLRYSDSMAMTRLMLYVSGGEFQPALSAFVVPVKKKREESGRRRRRKTVEEDEVCCYSREPHVSLFT